MKIWVEGLLLKPPFYYYFIVQRKHKKEPDHIKSSSFLCLKQLIFKKMGRYTTRKCYNECKQREG